MPKIQYPKPNDKGYDQQLKCIGDVRNLDFVEGARPLKMSELEFNLFLGLKEWSYLQKKVQLSEREIQCLYFYMWKCVPSKEIDNFFGLGKNAAGGYIRRARIKIRRVLNFNIEK